MAAPIGGRGAWPKVVVAPGAAVVIAHAGLGLALGASPVLATAHVAVVVVLSGLIAFGARRVEIVAWMAAYVAASDVLWRMTDARFFHEGAKYLLAGVLVVAGLRSFRSWRDVGLPALYLGAFVPAVALSVLAFGPGARELVSANLSGPLALAVSVVFFSQVRVSMEALRGVLWSLLAPIAAIAAVTANATRRARGSIVFANESNFATSAGFGPNQVSAILGLGVLVCFFLALTERSRRRQVFEVGVGLALLTQGLLTFSRGGTFNLLVAAVAASLLLARRIQRAGRLVVAVAAIVAVLALILVPRLETFTGGAFGERYTSFDTAERGVFAERDLEIFAERPLTGVGLGVASEYRLVSGGGRIAAHTEYTRMLAEQGVLGVISIVALFVMVVRPIRKAPPGVARVLAVGFGVWSLAVMTNAAMRIATISLAVGLATLASRLETPRSASQRAKGDSFGATPILP